MPTPTSPSPVATPASCPTHRSAVRRLCPPQLCPALALCIQVLALLLGSVSGAAEGPEEQGNRLEFRRVQVQSALGRGSTFTIVLPKTGTIGRAPSATPDREGVLV